MIKRQKMITTVPMAAFSEAFIKLFKCAAADFTIKVGSDGCTALVHYNEKVYEVEPGDGLYEELKNMLADANSALYIDLEILIEATPDILSLPQFLIALAQSLSSVKGRSLLNMALMISLFTPNKEETLWRSLWPLDETGMLLGKGVLEAVSTYGLDVLAGIIFPLQIRDGLRIYNEKEDGIFEKVTLNQEGEKDLDFFIYTVSESTVIC